MKKQQRFTLASRLGAGLALVTLSLGALMCLASCATGTPPVRSLPSYIKRVYIKEFYNRSRLYGAQAPLTLAVNDEFISDGRLEVVQSKRADVRLEGHIKSFTETNNGFSDDRYPLITTMDMTCVVELWDPYDADRIAPIGRWTVPAAITYTSDIRRSNMETVTEAKARLYHAMATNILDAIMNKASDPLDKLEQRGIQRYQERRGEGKFEPVITQPRFPKPTPAVPN